ncbi:hypothetical protein BDF21DRAFT_397903 [Thamnidium elegans]|nr:hypothetical protein BDF21DRAFT_397903 [Thamnidium elegans]
MLLNQLPNLKVFDISSTSHAKEYAEVLLYADMRHINKIDVGYFKPSSDSLIQFKQLAELVFRNKHDIDLTPFQVQEKYFNLKRLKFTSEYLISESTMLHLLDNSSIINLNFISTLTDLTLGLPSL